MTTALGAIFAAGAYTGRTYTNTLGMDTRERRAYLKKRLDDDHAIARNAVNYTPNLGALVAAWDNTVGNYDEMAISPYRSSGLSSGGFGSNPTSDKLNRLRDLPNQNAEQVGKTLRALTPFQGTIYGDLILNNL